MNLLLAIGIAVVFRKVIETFAASVLSALGGYAAPSILIVAEIALIFHLIHELKILWKESRIDESMLAEHSEIMSIKTVKTLLRICGSYFFVVKKGLPVITNADDQEARAIAAKLDRKDVRELLSTKKEGASSIEFRTALTGTEQHWYEMRLHVAKDARGKVHRQGVVILIDKRKQEERELMEMHIRAMNAEERDNFVHEMNHVIRNPLNAIVGFSEIISDQSDELSQQEIDEYTKGIVENADNLLKIIENVLTISHMDSETIFLDDHILNVKELMESAVSLSEEQLSKAGIEVQCQEGKPDSAIKADPRIMKIVLQQLFENVVRHAASGKSMTYGWKDTPAEVELFVSDKGPGISENDLPFIFKPFYKANPFSDYAGQGLAVAEGYLKHENAKIRCESEKGKGATFFISFAKKLPILGFLMALLTSCTNAVDSGPALMAGPTVLWVVSGLLLLVIAGLFVEVRILRRAAFDAKVAVLEQAEISRTLNAIGGHLFRINRGRILISQETADFFSFDTTSLDFKSTVESLDETNMHDLKGIMDAEPGKLNEFIISIPNFRTFKIMSFTVLATKIEGTLGDVDPMGMFYSLEEAKDRLEKMKESFIKDEESKEKQSFLARAGHEIRTPLNAIVGFSNLLAESHSEISAEERQSYLDIIKHNNEQLLELLDSTMMTEVEREAILKNSLKTAGIAPLVEEMYHTHQVIIPSRLEFKFEKGGEAYAKINRTSLRQVVSNLINNACKFTPEGSVTLGWEVNDDTIDIFVEDTGMGIPQEDQANIFRQFYKMDSSTSGAGIGLPLSKRLVEVMDGDLFVTSTVGKGSRFTIRLPKVSKDE